MYVHDPSEVKKKISIKIWPVGPGVYGHNVRCWECEKNPAIYCSYPHNVFTPCWDCRGVLHGPWEHWNRKWWQIWK